MQSIIRPSFLRSQIWLAIALSGLGAMLLAAPYERVALPPAPGSLQRTFAATKAQLPLASTPHKAHSIIAEKPAVKSCKHNTVMNIVAHEDDDILFMNPQISYELSQGYCMRTVYLTAGDDGRGQVYLQSREAGAETAYSVMLGRAQNWAYTRLTLGSGASVTVAAPQNNTNVSLIFLRLPDGNLDGSGFVSTDYQSLAKLHEGSLSSITSLDGQVAYDSNSLTATLLSLMELYQPIQLNTQANDADRQPLDHSDHIVAGQYATAAAQLFAAHSKSLKKGTHYFMGYPTRGLASNLSPAATAQKSTVFFAYAADDPGVCTSIGACESSRSTYAYYLSRQYQLQN